MRPVPAYGVLLYRGINRLGEFHVNVKSFCAAGFAAVLLTGIILFAGCSQKTGTYDELDKSGDVEKMVRRNYAAFFQAVQKLGSSSVSATDDTVLVNRATLAAARVVAEVKEYPGTIQSRLALDALSYAARELTRSPGFARPTVSAFWESSLLDPIITKGREYMQSGNVNTSTHIQLVRALQRGMDTKASTRTFLDVLPVVGPAPSPEVMELAASDSLVLKRIHDLILYSRSLQAASPPDWMLTGPWFLAIDIPGFFPCFYSLIPVLIDRDQYLTLRMYEPGAVYERVYHDPVPDNPDAYRVWLNRAETAMNPLRIDRTFAEGVNRSGLPVLDAHYFFNDYFVNTEIDSVKKEFFIILKRPAVAESNLRYTGVDSISIVFTVPKIARPESLLTTLEASRYIGKTLTDGQVTPERIGSGKAWLMPLGAHSDSILRRLREESLPKISVGTR